MLLPSNLLHFVGTGLSPSDVSVFVEILTDHYNIYKQTILYRIYSQKKNKAGLLKPTLYGHCSVYSYKKLLFCNSLFNPVNCRG